MALLPDLATAGLAAAVVFLLILGFLVVFVEAIRTAWLVVLVAGDVVVAAILAGLGELGVSLVVAAAGFALLASQGFEWLSTR